MRHTLQLRAIVVLCRQFLRFRRIEVFEIGASNLFRSVLLRDFVNNGNGRFGNDGGGGNHDFIFARIFLLREPGVGLPCNEHIANSTLRERYG